MSTLDTAARPPRYVFSINAGRSGSKYLAEIFRHVEGCVAFHEADPKCYGEPMRDFLSGRPEPMRALAREKASFIGQVTPPGHTYVETNHAFIKGFGWLLPEMLPAREMAVIVLRRDRGDVLRSLTSRRMTPLSHGGRNWIITPEVAQAYRPFPEAHPAIARMVYRLAWGARARLFTLGRRYGEQAWQAVRRRFFAAFEKRWLEWYIEETYARGDHYRRTFPQVRYVDVQLEALNTREGVQRMLDPLRLAALPSLECVLAVRADSMEPMLRERTGTC